MREVWKPNITVFRFAFAGAVLARDALRALVLMATMHSAGAMAAEPVTICYNYGCLVQAAIEFTPTQLKYLSHLFATVGDAAAERKILGRAIGRMYYFAGEKTPIWRDRGMNYHDDGVSGMMDCIDHTHNTGEFLGVLKRRGLLRFHEVRPPLRRTRFIFGQHWTARVADNASGAEYAVDAWFFDPGTPAAIMPIEDWIGGRDPRG